MLTDGMWSGERCFVVGGGPSLSGFNWSRLDGERVIAVNRAYEVLPRAIVCSMDLGFWKEHGARVEKRMPPWIRAGDGRPEARFPAVHVRVGDEKLPAHGPSHVFPCCADLTQPNPHLSAAWGTSLRSGIGCGGNSGFAAVNLADVLGAATVYLLGFDMRGSVAGGQAWFHGGYKQPQQKSDVYDRMIAAFEAVKDDIRADVVNLTAGDGVFLPSRMCAFRRIPAENII